MAAMRTCNGVSGVIQVGNETFIIHPFYGGDMSSQHPHLVYESRSPVQQACANTRMYEWGLRNYRHVPDPAPGRDGLRSPRDVRTVTKHIELALVLDKAMFDIRNDSKRESVTHDAIQIVNIADQYYKTLKTRISLVYIETWSAENQATISSAEEIRHALLNFKEYGSRHLYKISRDTTHLFTGERFKYRKTGMAVPGQICNENSYGVTVDSNVYEPHVTASTMAHVLGHVIGMGHDDRDGCMCTDWHGCIMAENIVGKDNVQPYRFSQCSRDDYLKELHREHGVCLLNRPNEVKIRSCGNGIVEDGEQCDCGSVDASECRRKDPCCDHMTCRLRAEAECSTGVCCQENCKLRPRGTLCRKAATECDVPEFCDGDKGTCPMDIHKKNGVVCAKGAGYCFGGVCPTRDQQCAQIWGYDSVSSDDQCYERFNTQGFVNGHCGKDPSGRFRKCEHRNVLCGLLQCQLGFSNPVVIGGGDVGDQTVSRTVISIRGQEFHCNVASGNMDPKHNPDHGMVVDGTRCGADLICVNQSCTSIHPHLDQGSCPRDAASQECSGNGVCTNMNTCFCNAGYAGVSCSVRTNISLSPPDILVSNQPTEKAGNEKGQSNFPIDTNARTTSLVKHDGNSTLHLVIVLVSMVGLIFLFFTFVALCYRRRSTMPKYGAAQNMMHKHGFPPKPDHLNHRSSGSVEDMEDSRMITFGSMPSYSASLPRDHKMQQRPVVYPSGAAAARGPGVGAALPHPPLPAHAALLGRPELQSHHSSLPRHTGLSASSTCALDQDDDDDGFLDHPRANSISKTPEKGILKKAGSGGLYGSVGGERWTEESQSDNNEVLSQSDNNHDSDTNGQVTEVERTLKSLNGYHEDILEALRNAASARGTSSTSYSDELRKSVTLSSDVERQLSAVRAGAPLLLHGGADSPAPPGAGAGAGAPIRIRNLEDLIRQLERPPARLPSPNTNSSEELRLSETEADRQLRLESSSCTESQGRFSGVGPAGYVLGRFREPASGSTSDKLSGTSEATSQPFTDDGTAVTGDTESDDFLDRALARASLAAAAAAAAGAAATAAAEIKPYTLESPQSDDSELSSFPAFSH